MKYILFLILIFSSVMVFAQVDWKFSSKKIANKTYELHAIATIDYGWHIYPQKMPEGSIGLPTSFTFQKNPLVTLSGKVVEIGHLVIKNNEALGGVQHEYHDSVEFVQTVKLKGNVKTSISGSVEFMTCTDQQCLSPEKVPFTLKLD